MKPKKQIRWLGWLLALILLLSTGWACWEIYAALRDLPAWQMDSVPLIAPSTLYAADGTPFATLGRGSFIPVAQKDIPPVVKEAFVAAEDNRFYNHPGIDVRGILRAAWYDLLNHKVVQGGSTITQQLAKNAFLTPSRTFKRKIQEIFLAIELERHYTKDEIMTFYLNRIYFGEGAWGIGTASRIYFDKDVKDLSTAEAALLAGLVRTPSYYDPFKNPEIALARRNTVLRQMWECGFISAQEAARAEQEPLGLKRGFTSQSQYQYPDFVDYIIDSAEEKLDESALFRGGLKIYTTLDIKAQSAAEEVIKNPAYFPPSFRDTSGGLQPQAAVVLLDPQTGAIKAMVGAREHMVARQFNRAYQASRQPGSAIKPILVYGPAVEYLGMTPNSAVVDEPVRFGNYQPRNWDGVYRGSITLQDALAYSVNVVAVKLLHMVGMEKACNFARSLGIDVSTADGLQAALGGLSHGVTPLQMAAAYAAFANGGYYVRPYAITRIVQPDGVVLAEFHPERKPAMKKETATTIATMLKAAVRYGTGANARIDDLAAGKTGTTDEGKDLWFCGWVPQMEGVVWIGWDVPRPMPGAYGSQYCTRIWREIIIRALDLKAEPVLPSPSQPTKPKPENTPPSTPVPSIPPGSPLPATTPEQKANPAQEPGSQQEPRTETQPGPVLPEQKPSDQQPAGQQLPPTTEQKTEQNSPAPDSSSSGQ
ncbi:PBP1A family penicillin-binding protein [Desulfofundulus sp.]|uniref:transglycosylase domain-containing protein n=1 Tax=Desulfofundulus sp. TaxID=2282750 RepID=UPI003C73D59D